MMKAARTAGCDDWMFTAGAGTVDTYPRLLCHLSSGAHSTMYSRKIGMNHNLTSDFGLRHAPCPAWAVAARGARRRNAARLAHDGGVCTTLSTTLGSFSHNFEL